MFQKRIPNVTLCCLLFIHIQAPGYTGQFQDQTSPRTNTLFDDADDIQRQLDNEARDRIKYGRPKTIWVFHFPVYMGQNSALMDTTEVMRRTRDIKRRIREEYADKDDPNWDYPDQGSWVKKFPDCGGKAQSPVDLPVSGLLKPRGARTMLFQNYDVVARTMTLQNDGKRLILAGDWKREHRPLIYGGAAHSRRYLFDSLVFHLPAEHTLGGLYYPFETQAFFVSAEYKNMEDALESSSSDPQSLLAISNIYSYGNHTHQGLMDILVAAKRLGTHNGTVEGKTLTYFNPPFKEYAVYQGSLTTPPCTESVLWLIRGRTLHIKRETWDEARALLISKDKQISFRETQPLNDRKVYFFK